MYAGKFFVDGSGKFGGISKPIGYLKGLVHNFFSILSIQNSLVEFECMGHFVTVKRANTQNTMVTALDLIASK